MANSIELRCVYFYVSVCLSTIKPSIHVNFSQKLLLVDLINGHFLKNRGLQKDYEAQSIFS